MVCTRLDVLSTRIENMDAFIVFELLAEQIFHRSSEKERRKVSAKNCVWPRMRNRMRPSREERT